MKPKILKFLTVVLLFLPFGIVLLGAGCEEDEVSSDDYILLEDIKAKVFKAAKSLDDNNQPKDYNWAISANENYLDMEDTPIDTNILAPLNLPDEFKISGLKIKISGKKYINKNQVLTSPFFRNGFGYAFEIIKIEKLN